MCHFLFSFSLSRILEGIVLITFVWACRRGSDRNLKTLSIAEAKGTPSFADFYKEQ